ncbi:MAG: response regulator [Desulfobulbaceae bacterium]|nr:response regulator [Desulfobulbaceae bacterium]
MNLVTNASEAVEESGQVTIETENKTIDTQITTCHGIIYPGAYVVVSVQDSGVGISLPELSRIFEPFYSKKELGRSGTGLGLAVVWNTIQDHDGGIKVTSDESGSRFELYFPRSLENLQSAGHQADMETFTGNGESILVVDDELQQRDIASQLLGSLGYNVESVTSGEAAIEYVRQKKVDLVLLDMILESGMNGLQTYEGIIQLYPDQKAIVISGYSASDDVRRTLKIGAGSFINKPYTAEQLARAVFCELEKTPKAY